MNRTSPVAFPVVLLVGFVLACAASRSGAIPDEANSPGGRSVATAAAGAALTGPFFGQADSASLSWQPAGFGGAGNFDGVFFDPNQPGVVYAASDVAGVFRSADNGDHWQMRSVGLGNYEVSSFAVDPFDSNTLYAGAGAFASSAKSGIYASYDAGLTWQQLPSTSTLRITFRRFRTINAIAPDPAHKGVILSGSRENGIWRTTDGGDSWTQVYSTPLTHAPLFVNYEDDRPNPYPAPVSIVFFDPADSNTVYAGLDGAGVVRSTNGGVSWRPIDAGLPASATIKYLAVSNNHVLYAAVGTAGVYTSANGGDSWQAANGSPPLPLVADYDPGGHPAWVSSVAVHPANPDIAYLSLATYDHANVWKTVDGGATWVAKGDVMIDPVNDPTEAWATTSPGGDYWPYTLSWQVTLDPHDSNRLFYVSYWDIVRSDDGGEHWMNKIVGAQNTCVTALAVDTDHPVGQPDKLYATHWDAGLLASTNRGVTWTAVIPSQFNDPMMAGHYWRIALARSGGVKYYYAVGDPDTSYGQALRSTDGVSWTTVFTNPRPTGTWMGGFMLGLAVDPSTPSTLYLLQDGGQVWKSTSHGDPGTWSPTGGQPGGNSFTYALTVDAVHRIYAGTIRDGLWRSMDGGQSWQNVLTAQSTIFQALAVSNTVYAAAGDANLHRSTDGGDTWQQVSHFITVDDGDGVGDQGMAIAVDPRNPQHLFFSRRDVWHSADSSPGLVESTDGGNTWTPANAGLGHRGVSALTIGPRGDVFAGTSCGGIWRRTAVTSHYLPVVLKTQPVAQERSESGK